MIKIETLAFFALAISYMSGVVRAAPYDDYKAWAETQTGSATGAATTTDPTTLPGFAGTELPETSYHSSQDYGTMSTDGVNAIPNTEAGQTSWDLAQQPKLVFSPADPIFATANDIIQNTTATDVGISSTFTACTSSTSTTPPVYVEKQCTAWTNPVVSQCNKVLNIDVVDVSSCATSSFTSPVPQYNYPVFAVASGILHTRSADDVLYVHVVCDPSLPDIKMIVTTTDGKYCAAESTEVMVPANTQITERYLSKTQGMFTGSGCGSDANVYVTYTSNCDTDGLCTFDFYVYDDFLETAGFSVDIGSDSTVYEWVPGSSKDIIVDGGVITLPWDYPSDPVYYEWLIANSYWGSTFPTLASLEASPPKHLHGKLASMTFQKPRWDHVIANEAWDNQCATLEAQVP